MAARQGCGQPTGGNFAMWQFAQNDIEAFS
jgi:hypothetical protein